MGLHVIRATNKYNIRDRIGDCYEYDKKSFISQVINIKRSFTSCCIYLPLHQLFPPRRRTRRRITRGRDTRERNNSINERNVAVFPAASSSLRERHAANKPINRINGRRDLIKEWRLHPRQRCLHFVRQLYRRCLSIGHEIR